MANGTLNVALKKDWLLANPWLWLGVGLALTFCAWSAARYFGPNAGDLRVIILAGGLLATGVGVHLRWRDRQTVYLQGRAAQAGVAARFVMGCLFLAAGLGLILYFGLSCLYGHKPGWFPGATFLVCLSVAPASLMAARRCLIRKDRKLDLDVDEEVGLALMAAVGVCVLGWYALYLGPARADDWDSIRLFLRVLAGVCLLGAALVVAAQLIRRLTLSLLFILHFCAIANAALSVDPAPWLIKQTYLRLSRPYLEFMYLINAYRYFSPDPWPSSYIWFRVIFTTPEGRDHGLWYKVPGLDEDGNIQHPVALEYQRYLAMTASVEADEPQLALAYWFDAKKHMWDGYPLFANRLNLQPTGKKLEPNIGQELPNHVRIPLNPVLPWAQQVRIPNDISRKMLSSYARFVARKFAVHPDHPDWEFKQVKVYRVTHNIPDVSWYRLKMSPTDPVLYRPYYSGLYDAEGVQQFDQDPYLYWMLPILRVKGIDPDSDIVDYLRLHAGDPHCFRDGETRTWQKHPEGDRFGREQLPARVRVRAKPHAPMAQVAETGLLMKPISAVLPSWLRRWEQFWFTPGDPTVLALIRILCGMIVVYTLLAYSFSLHAFMGAEGWHDLDYRLKFMREKPVFAGPLNWNVVEPPHPPQTEFEEEYREAYLEKWNVAPPTPYPEHGNMDQVRFLDLYRKEFNFDLRTQGLRPPKTKFEETYAFEYTATYRVPPPAYAKTRQEAKEIDDYMQSWQRMDPRLIHTKGVPLVSLWFHVTDPAAMAVIHGLFTLCAFLFTIGFCTRFTAVLTWFASLCYVQRNPTILFGVDTMMMILLLYLMIGPSGAAFSVDRLIGRWWHTAKPGVIQAGVPLLRRRPIPGTDDIAPSAWNEIIAPSAAANVAIRLLQIHVCIIYLIAGLSKLIGQTWWNGTALWTVLGNYELAPMQYEAYLVFLRVLGSHQLVYSTFITGAGYFTLAFEIGYTFLVWRPRLRWIVLGSAILLHGGIGLFMGLKTFSLIMLVMNMAFVRKEEALWALRRVGLIKSDAVAAPPTPTMTSV